MYVYNIFSANLYFSKLEMAAKIFIKYLKQFAKNNDINKSYEYIDTY